MSDGGRAFSKSSRKRLTFQRLSRLISSGGKVQAEGELAVYLDQLETNVAGLGCTTCIIGNSGNLRPEGSKRLRILTSWLVLFFRESEFLKDGSSTESSRANLLASRPW